MYKYKIGKPRVVSELNKREVDNEVDKCDCSKLSYKEMRENPCKHNGIEMDKDYFAIAKKRIDDTPLTPTA